MITQISKSDFTDSTVIGVIGFFNLCNQYTPNKRMNDA